MRAGSIGAINQRIAELEAPGVQLNADEEEELRTLRQWRAERMAHRRTQFERERAPLFADQIPATQPEAYIQAAEQSAQMWRELQEKHQNFAVTRRLEVAGAVSPEDFAAMDDRWNSFQGPRTPTYEADFWLQRYRETFHKNPPDIGYVVSDAEGARYVYGASWPPPHADRWKLDAATIDAEKQKRISPALFGGE